MTSPVFVDTSAWCAIYDRSDKHHLEAGSYWRHMAGSLGLLYTSDYVVDETITLIRMRLSHSAAVQFGRLLLSSKVVQVVAITPQTQEQAWSLFVRYDDKEFSFTDCTSFTIMRTLSIRQAMTFDHHYSQMGFTVVP